MHNEYKVENALKVLEELNTDPHDFSEALGRDVFSNVIECHGYGDDGTSDSSDTSEYEQGRVIGGICPSKIILCRECFSDDCAGECTGAVIADSVNECTVAVAANNVSARVETADSPITVGLARNAPAAEKGSAENWFPMSGSEENMGQVRLTEEEIIELYGNFEDSDHDY